MVLESITCKPGQSWLKMGELNKGEPRKPFQEYYAYTGVSLQLTIIAMSPCYVSETWAASVTAMPNLQPPGPKNKEFAVWGLVYLVGGKGRGSAVEG